MSRLRKLPARRTRLQLETLEARIAPAFDLTIGAGKMVDVLHDSQGNFTATGPEAAISVASIRADLLAGKDVTISNGKAGTEPGNITWMFGAPLDFDGA